MCQKALCSTLGKGTLSGLQWKQREPRAFWENINNVPAQSKARHGFNPWQLPQETYRLFFLIRMTATVFLFPDYNGDVRYCEKLQGTPKWILVVTTAHWGRHGMSAEVDAEPHSLLSSQRRRMTLDLPVPLHQGCPNGLLCPWHVPSGQLPLAQI